MAGAKEDSGLAVDPFNDALGETADDTYEDTYPPTLLEDSGAGVVVDADSWSEPVGEPDFGPGGLEPATTSGVVVNSTWQDATNAESEETTTVTGPYE